jgi:hypothetical protein
VAGGDLFVVTNLGGSVTEVDVSTGAPVGVVSGPVYKFNDEAAMAVAGGYVFVANAYGNSVTELPV